MPPPSPGDAKVSTGAQFVEAVRRGWYVDDPAAIQALRVASTAIDRLVLLDAALDGPRGLLAALAAGRTNVRAVEALLRARRDAHAELGGAMASLALDDAPARGAIPSPTARWRKGR